MSTYHSYNICLGVLFLFACFLQCTSGSTSPDSPLGNLVLYSVAKTTNLTATQSIRLANNITQGLKQEGVSDEDCNLCKKRSEDYLIRLFKTDPQNSDCLQVEKLLEGDSYNASIFGVTADSRCTRPQYDTECFPSNSQALCSWSQSFEPIENANSDIFPKYVVNTVCKGCHEYDKACLNQHRQCYTYKREIRFHILRKTNRCSSDGYEEWVRSSSEQKITVACSCHRRRHG